VYGRCCGELQYGGKAALPERANECQFPCFIVEEKLAKCKFYIY